MYYLSAKEYRYLTFVHTSTLSPIRNPEVEVILLNWTQQLVALNQQARQKTYDETNWADIISIITLLRWRTMLIEAASSVDRARARAHVGVGVGLLTMPSHHGVHRRFCASGHDEGVYRVSSGYGKMTPFVRCKWNLIGGATEPFCAANVSRTPNCFVSPHDWRPCQNWRGLAEVS